jgi:hypothetical protein
VKRSTKAAGSSIPDSATELAFEYQTMPQRESVDSSFPGMEALKHRLKRRVSPEYQSSALNRIWMGRPNLDDLAWRFFLLSPSYSGSQGAYGGPKRYQRFYDGFALTGRILIDALETPIVDLKVPMQALLIAMRILVSTQKLHIGTLGLAVPLRRRRKGLWLPKPNAEFVL